MLDSIYSLTERKVSPAFFTFVIHSSNCCLDIMVSKILPNILVSYD